MRSFQRTFFRLVHPLRRCGEQLECLRHSESQVHWLSRTKAAQEKEIRLLGEKLSETSSRLQICEGILLYVLSNSGDTSIQLNWYLKKIQKILRPPKDHLDS